MANIRLIYLGVQTNYCLTNSFTFEQSNHTLQNAFEQSNHTLQNTADFVSEHKFLSNWLEVEHLGWRLPTKSKPHDRCVIICLIGGGQEINTGEAGLSEWLMSLKNHYKHWDVFLSSQITDSEYLGDLDVSEQVNGLNYKFVDDLHLKTSVRSFRSEKVSDFVKALLDLDKKTAKEIFSELSDKYPILLTRDLSKAKEWVKNKSRGNERFGMIASSNAHRMLEFGIFLNLKFDIPNWFLNSKEDIRSSYFMEYVAT